jgi:hypothetical protein
VLRSQIKRHGYAVVLLTSIAEHCSPSHSDQHRARNHVQACFLSLPKHLVACLSPLRTGFDSRTCACGIYSSQTGLSPRYYGFPPSLSFHQWSVFIRLPPTVRTSFCPIENAFAAVRIVAMSSVRVYCRAHVPSVCVLLRSTCQTFVLHT